jgi:NAD(P)H dehydrogenase (quinone)
MYQHCRSNFRRAGAYAGKYGGIFVSTGTMGGGQETTVTNALSTLTHHGIVFVALGYKTTFHIFLQTLVT